MFSLLTGTQANTREYCIILLFVISQVSKQRLDLDRLTVAHTMMADPGRCVHSSFIIITSEWAHRAESSTAVSLAIVDLKI